uniref:Uncharacterized protein n=1 Tax=Rhizophora mucronata TaxID=61149 RepID=A0A2P2NUQ8_RHIMU
MARKKLNRLKIHIEYS